MESDLMLVDRGRVLAFWLSNRRKIKARLGGHLAPWKGRDEEIIGRFREYLPKLTAGALWDGLRALNAPAPSGDEFRQRAWSMAQIQPRPTEALLEALERVLLDEPAEQGGKASEGGNAVRAQIRGFLCAFGGWFPGWSGRGPLPWSRARGSYREGGIPS